MKLALLVIGVILATGGVVSARRTRRGRLAAHVEPVEERAETGRFSGDVVGGHGANRPGRILVIDDEPPIAQLLEDALTADGHAVEVAVCGRDGVHLAETSAFDLVLSDLGMPDMTGWEVVSRIHTASPQTPVVLVTGWGTSLDEDEVERSGVTAVVQKPFDIEDLLATTRRILRERPRSAAVAPGGARSCE